MIGSVPLTQVESTDWSDPLQLGGATVLQLTVNNGAIYVQLGRGVGSFLWTPEAGSFRLPGVHTIPGPLDAIRVKAVVEPAAGRDWPSIAADAY